MAKTYLPLSELQYDGYKFVFLNPLVICVLKDEDGYEIQNSDLEIDVFAETYDEAYELLKEDMEFLWSELAECPEDKLVPKAQQFKTKMRAIMKRENG